MSRQTSRILKAAPSGATGTLISVTSAAGWGFTPWVELIASAAAGTEIEGFVVTASSGIGAQSDVEFQVGVGAASSESVISTYRMHWSPANNGPTKFWFPGLITGIATSARIAMRISSRDGGTFSANVVLLYYDGTTDTDVSTANIYTTEQLTSNNVSITPSGTAWANSTAVTLKASGAGTIDVAGLTFNPAVSEEVEFDILFNGVLKTTLRTAAETTDGHRNVLLLPAVYPVPTSTAITVQMRKAGTNTDAWSLALLQYGTTTPEKQGSTVFGVNTTVTSTRSFAVGLDGNTNTLNESGKMKVFGNFEVTGTATFSGGLSSTALETLSNVSTTSTQSGDLLRFNGSLWVNSSMSAALDALGT